MFVYDKKIDKWSQKMISGIKLIWGNKIDDHKKKTNFSTMPFLINYLNDYLTNYGDIIFKRLNKLTGLSLKISDFKYFINTTPVSLHNSHDSYISISKEHAFNSYPTIIIHEISHIYIYEYLKSTRFLEYNKILKTSDLISEGEKNELKEIVTVMINMQFIDIIDSYDDGYPNHKDIREKILKLWKKDNNFNEWISKTIKLYKKNGK